MGRRTRAYQKNIANLRGDGSAAEKRQKINKNGDFKRISTGNKENIPPPPVKSLPPAMSDPDGTACNPLSNQNAMQSVFRHAHRRDCVIPGLALANGFLLREFTIINGLLLSHEEIDRESELALGLQDFEPLETLPELFDLDEDSENDDEDADLGNPPSSSQVATIERWNPTEPSEDKFIAPLQIECVAALADLSALMRPRDIFTDAWVDPKLDLWTRARREGMQALLRTYTDQRSVTYNCWGTSAFQVAVSMGRGLHCARRLKEMCRAFITDRKVLPVNPYGDWNKSLLVDEALQNEISIYLLLLGKNITAFKLMEFLHTIEIEIKYGIERKISERTARRYLHELGYRYKSTPKGQYADGHEREDVVFYRQNVFLPEWRRLEARMATWDKQLVEVPPCASNGRRVMVWVHDETVFYAHDRRRKGWYHKDAPAKPYAKGEGASLMVADFVSADLGWLRSPDGTKSARRLFKPGKNRDGYFSNEEILEQVREAMDILDEHYPEYEHVFVYDNAPTHLKREDGALSARRMPKNTPKAGTNWGVEITKRDPVSGKPVCKPDGTHEKIKIQMRDTQLRDGTVQSLYFPDGHPRAGIFKGMAVILEERGYGDMSKTRAECKKFACAPGATDCCCRHILYNEHDFANVETILQTFCKARGYTVLFLPKFHCELNFIEQCWGYAKSIYRTYPESSREDQLESNTIRALESIPLSMMRKFATRSARFMDAYCRGLNGRQAAWASRKYRGHRVLPNDILEKLDEASIV